MGRIIQGYKSLLCFPSIPIIVIWSTKHLSFSLCVFLCVKHLISMDSVSIKQVNPVKFHLNTSLWLFQVRHLIWWEFGCWCWFLTTPFFLPPQWFLRLVRIINWHQFMPFFRSCESMSMQISWLWSGATVSLYLLVSLFC